MAGTDHALAALNPGAADDALTALCNRFYAMINTTTTPVTPIWDLSFPGATGQKPSLTAVLDFAAQTYAAAVRAGRDYLPLPYQDTYVEPLLRYLGRVVRAADDPSAIAQIMAGAVAQHQADSPARQPLRQFLAIVSNLYRSFLASDKRTAARVPVLDATLPPLVTFHPDVRPEKVSPGLLATPVVRGLCGSEVAVAVLPANYYRTPLSWAAVAHEACGHGVLRADQGLLEELVAGTRVLFGGGPIVPGEDTLNEPQALGLLWSYWLEETASDVYGLLNIGPTFILNVAALVSALRRGLDPTVPVPRLSVDVGTEPADHLDTHPPDLFRLHVAIGVIENLETFPARAARPYLQALRKLSAFCANGAARMHARGRVEVKRDYWVSIDRAFPLKDMAEAARRVGAYVATTRLTALGNQSVQRLETWDLADEAAAQAICAALLKPPPTAGVAPERAAVVVDLLRNDRLDQLNDADRAALDLTVPLATGSEAILAALAADRIEDPALGDLIRPLQLDRIAEMGDDAQLLAGATLAALYDSSPIAFRWINRRLAWALSRSYDHDELMGPVHLHAMVDSIHPLGAIDAADTDGAGTAAAEAEPDNLEAASDADTPSVAAAPRRKRARSSSRPKKSPAVSGPADGKVQD
jgi:hypothetical protein